jgi:hypothetical protein
VLLSPSFSRSCVDETDAGEDLVSSGSVARRTRPPVPRLRLCEGRTGLEPLIAA